VQALRIIFLAALPILPSKSVEGREVDIVATAMASDQQATVATIRGEVAACRAIYGLDSWLEWNRQTNEVVLVDRSSNTSAVLDEAGVRAWGKSWENRLDGQRNAARAMASRDDVPPEAREIIKRYADGARAFQGKPPVAARVTPAPNSRRIVEFIGFQQRLNSVKALMRVNLQHADLAVESLSCIMPVEFVPSDFSYPLAKEQGTVNLIFHDGTAARQRPPRSEPIWFLFERGAGSK